MCVQNLNFLALHVPELIYIFIHQTDGSSVGYPKKWTVPGYAHAPFSLKFLVDFCWTDPLIECTGLLAKFEIRSFSRS